MTMLFQTGRLIDQNMTLTCSPSDPGADFVGDNALAQALASLENYDITGTVTIQLADGVYGAGTPLSTIVAAHRNMSNIFIKGNTAPAIAFDIAEAANPPDTDNAYIHIDNTAGSHSPNDFYPGGDHLNFVVHVVGSTGNDGAYRVVGASTAGTDIRLEMEAGTVKDATQNGTLYLLPSNHCQFLFGNNHGLAVNTPGRLSVDGVSLCTDGTDNTRCAIVTGIGGTTIAISRTIFSNYSTGVAASNGAVLTYVEFPSRFNCNVALTRVCGYNVFMNASAFLNYSVASVPTGDGFLAFQGAQIRGINTVASRCNVGFRTVDSGTITAAGSSAHNNNLGYRASNAGLINRDSSYVYGNISDYDPAGTPPIESAAGGRIV